MNNLIEEIDNNFESFFNSVSEDVANATEALKKNKPRFNESYRRLVSLQAWRSELLESESPSKVDEFFKEAQNDALMSHALARQGAWRVALMSLRSCIENTLFGLYYRDHPVELIQWEQSKHKLGFSETINYLVTHPEFAQFSEQQTGIDIIKNEYSTLSKAVHGSSKSFRVTKGGKIEGLNIASVADLGSWLSRERIVIIGLNLILITFYKKQLQGASKVNLRKALSLAIPSSKFVQIKSDFGVKLTNTSLNQAQN